MIDTSRTHWITAGLLVAAIKEGRSRFAFGLGATMREVDRLAFLAALVFMRDAP